MSRTPRGTSAAPPPPPPPPALPPPAAAAPQPGVSTGGASKVTITTATLNGKVNPHGAATTYFFQYGTTPAYGSRTPDAGAGAGTAAVGASAPVAGLGPNTKYHYRLVARNGAGTTVGGDHTFAPPQQPPRVAPAAPPHPPALRAPPPPARPPP